MTHAVAFTLWIFALAGLGRADPVGHAQTAGGAVTLWLLVACCYVSGLIGFWPEVKTVLRAIRRTWLP